MNTHASYTDLPWSAVSKMKTAGYGWANHSVDFVFFPQNQGARLANSSTGPLVSDHQWLTARIDMNGAGPPSNSNTDAGTATVADTSSTTSGSSGDVDAAAAAPPAGDVLPALMQLRFSDAYPTLTTGWGRRAQVTHPTLAAQAFFGRAQHTSNPGLLDIPGWERCR